jgi:hypothetical protein
MFIIENTQIANLPDLATCHMACFKDSLAARLGKLYVQKTFEWFLVSPNRFLFHSIKNEK